jgi:hypothetical protein
VYQAWCSIDAWLQLTTAEQVIYLEGAEDFDVLSEGGAITVQVRHTEAPISLGTGKAREALQHFWTLNTREQSRQIDYHYLTTSPVATEQDGDFGGLNGLDAWRAACTNLELAASVSSYLQSQLPPDSELRQFLESSSPNLIQERLFRRFHWLSNQPGIDAVLRSVEDRIRVLLHQQRRSIGLAPKVRLQLESRFWQIIVLKESADRRLTLGDLLREVEEAATTYLPVPVDQIPDLINARPGLGLLQLLIQKVPHPPSPLIQRTDLVQRIEQAVNQRRSILLTGSVFKGKTTVAQLVAVTHFPDAWWINVTGRRPDQVDNILLALSGELDGDVCPPLLVIDDLDIGPSAHRIYRDSLGLVLHRTRASGRTAIISAQGGSSDMAAMSEFVGVEVIEVPALHHNEVTNLCIQEGCTKDDAEFWGATIHAFSAGHPKLVQVRVAELAKQGWPRPGLTYLTTPSSASDTVRQRACRLLSDSLPQEVVEYLYCASECTVLLHRSVAIKLAELIGGIRNPGDVLGNLAGKWLDCVENDWFRATPLLRGAAGDAWSPQQRARAHVRLHDSIYSKGTLDPAEAAALLYHAYFGKEPRRLTMAALKLQIIEDDRAKEAVERNLLWLPYVALEPGERLGEDAMAAASLRGLQFRVARTLNSDTLPKICARWIEATALVESPQLRQGLEIVMWTSIAIADSENVPLAARLEAIQSIGCMQLTGEIATLTTDGLKSFVAHDDYGGHFPPEASAAQILLVFCARWIRSAGALRALLQWLDTRGSEDFRRDFDSAISWPLVQTLGAFVQSAWAAAHEDVDDWMPWLDILDTIDEYAKRRASPSLGREAAKAKAIILSEYLARPNDALQELSIAEHTFGVSPVLTEQRVNVLHRINDDERVLEIWETLLSDPAYQHTSDPFAYRRAAISASRLGKWQQAEAIFCDASVVAKGEGFQWTRFGLLVDCSLASSLGGSQRRAADILADAVTILPASAPEEGDARGEAVQRAASEVCRRIQSALWNPSDSAPKIQPGFASSPDLEVPECQSGQDLRTALLRGQVARLAACVGVGTDLVRSAEVLALDSSPYPFARWLYSETRFAASFAKGAEEDFIPSLVKFVCATTALRQDGLAAFDGSQTGKAPTSIGPYRWLGLLVAGACCAGSRLDTHLSIWLDACEAMRDAPEGLAELIQQIQAASMAESWHELWRLAFDVNLTPAARCGAAVKLMLTHQAPRDLFRVQCLLASALASDESVAFQEMCNLHLADRFAREWDAILRNPFQLPSPRRTVPAIRATLDGLKDGRRTLRTLLTDVAGALGIPLVEWIDRIQ